MKNKPHPGIKEIMPTFPGKLNANGRDAVNLKTKHSGDWKTSLAGVLEQHSCVNADGTTASQATQDKYADVLYAGFRTLREELGYKLGDVKGFRGKHIEALAQHWEQQCREGKLSPATVQNQMSIFRRFSAWIGKEGMVEGSNKYVSPECCSRTAINTIDKSWDANGVDMVAKIAEVTEMDSRVGLQLELSMAFGLRAREAMQLCPHVADKGTYLEVTKGTKGGRPRVVPIRTLEQRELLDRAKAFASSKTGSTSNPAMRLSQVKNHHYYVLRRCEVSRKSGFTHHGLRHGYANQRYKEISGQESPVQGGKVANKEDDAVARQQIAEELGHSRADITNHYLGKDKGDG